MSDFFTGSNLGTGNGQVYLGSNNEILYVRSLTGSSGISVAMSSGTITIADSDTFIPSKYFSSYPEIDEFTLLHYPLTQETFTGTQFLNLGVSSSSENTLNVNNATGFSFVPWLIPSINVMSFNSIYVTGSVTTMMTGLTNALLNEPEITISFWIKTDPAKIDGGFRNILSYSLSNGFELFRISKRFDAEMIYAANLVCRYTYTYPPSNVAYSWNDLGLRSEMTRAVYTTWNEWSHIALVINQSLAKYYINGRQVGQSLVELNDVAYSNYFNFRQNAFYIEPSSGLTQGSFHLLLKSNNTDAMNEIQLYDLRIENICRSEKYIKKFYNAVRYRNY